MALELEEKVAVITGAGQGIGAAIADRLAQEGAYLALCDINFALVKRQEKKVSQIRGREAIAIQVDVADRSQVERMRDIVLERFHRVDILINNAGICKVCPIDNLEEELWDRLMDINLKGVYLCTRALIPGMIKQGNGRIVNISSMAGKIGGRWMTAYSASKAGVISFTKSLAREVAQYGINVNCVCPGIVSTELWHACEPNHARKLGRSENTVSSYYRSRIPLGRLCTPEDVAKVVYFLVSPASSYMTGQALNVTGGQQMD